MLLHSRPPCGFPLSGGTGKQINSTSQRFTLPLWPARPAASLVALRSLQEILFPEQQAPSRKANPSASTHIMSSPHNIQHGSPRSPAHFSPTLGSIQEVFEYEPLEITSPVITPLTPPLDGLDASPGVLPEPATPAEATISTGPRTKGIIVNPRKGRPTLASTKVVNVLRHVLEADRLRRQRALRIYLKVIVFLKLLLKSHERYGAIMATSGVYMQR
jgi:hypothetical protein